MTYDKLQFYSIQNIRYNANLNNLPYFSSKVIITYSDSNKITWTINKLQS